MIFPRLIPLGRPGRPTICGYALVDEHDYERVSRRGWSMSSGGYARRFVGPRGNQRLVLMHREILGLAVDDARVTDHINGNKLDNRRCNLRAVTRLENAGNRLAIGDCVQYQNRNPNRPWAARVAIAGKQKSLGYFETRAEALRAVERVREEIA